MKITIISYDNWKLNQKLVDYLQSLQQHEIKHIDFHQFKYKYSSLGDRIYNVLLKTFFKKNIKNIHYGKKILNELEKNEKQDLIITIKGDFIDPNSIKNFKKHTNQSIGFFNDSSRRCPKIKRVYHLFDKAFSFEKDDCKEFSMFFLTNWIFTTPQKNENYIYQISNVSSMDNRFKLLDRISSQLQKLSIKYLLCILN